MIYYKKKKLSWFQSTQGRKNDKYLRISKLTYHSKNKKPHECEVLTKELLYLQKTAKTNQSIIVISY